MKRLIIILAVLCFFSADADAQKVTQTRKIEKLITNVIDSGFRSSVLISAYDTLKQVADNSVFSGVVVSAEGHILTVAHATRPKEVYLITFPDGVTHLAEGLGRIAVAQEGRDLDLAMIKIIKPGKWPFSKMAWNTEMKVNQPAVSISYPGSFDRKQPNVRVGVLSKVDYTEGYFVSTCKMEPGDSGGPVFDATGRVIGLHSWVEANEDFNFEVPVDLYRKYWSALNVAKNYKELPQADTIISIPTAVSISAIPPIQELAEIPGQFSKSTLAIHSSRGQEQLDILGTIITYDFASTNDTYILSKSSMVADQPGVMLQGKKIPLTVISRDNENDLILLKVLEKLPSGIRLKADLKPLELSNENLGNFLVSSLGNGLKKVGVLSTVYTNMLMRFSVGYFGANANFINKKITITDISEGSAAAVNLKLNDQVIGVNGVPISKPAEYGAELSKYLAGDSISIDAIRDGQEIHLKMFLPAYPGENHVASQFEGGRSARSDGFNRVLVQDAAIVPEKCGGPVFNIKGQFYGINIARHSRTSTIIMPVDVISKFIKQALKS